MATSEVNRAVGSKGMSVWVEDKATPNVTPAPTPITVSAITKANPAAVTTSSAHGLSAGDRVTFSAVGGMVEINGQSAAVDVTSPTSFKAVGIDSTGFTTYTTGGSVTESGFHQICFKTFNIAPGTATEIDVTTTCSEAKEFVMGLQDFGTATIDLNYDPCNNGIMELESAAADTLSRWFRVVFPPGLGSVTKLVQGYVQSIGFSAGVEAAITSTATVRLTGRPQTYGCTP